MQIAEEVAFTVPCRAVEHIIKAAGLLRRRAQFGQRVTHAGHQVLFAVETGGGERGGDGKGRVQQQVIREVAQQLALTEAVFNFGFTCLIQPRVGPFGPGAARQSR